MQQIRIFGPAPKADLEAELNALLGNVHQAAKVDIRVGVADVEVFDEADPAETVRVVMFYAVVIVDSIRRDLAADPTLPAQPRPTDPD